VLDPQEDQIADSEDLAYPAYGQSLPPFELRDPIAGITIDSEAINRTAIVTGIFTFCPAECGILLRRLVGVQRRVADAGLTDETLFLPITFDPERDDDGGAARQRRVDRRGPRIGQLALPPPGEPGASESRRGRPARNRV